MNQARSDYIVVRHMMLNIHQVMSNRQWDTETYAISYSTIWQKWARTEICVHTHTGCWPGAMSPTLWVSDIAVIQRVPTKLLRQWVALMSSGIRCEAHITNTMASYWSQHFSERFVTHRSIICRGDTGSLGPKWSQILSLTISFYLALPPLLWELIAWFINRMSGASGCRIRQKLE